MALAGGFACGNPLAPEAADFLVERAGGNPLYLRELVSMARAQGLLVDDGDQYRLSATGAVPATLQALLAARLDSLEPDQKLALQLAAVMGGARVDDLSSLGAPNASAAVRALSRTGSCDTRHEGHYDTVDSLLREVAYETLPRNVRGELHRRAAAIVVAPEERARHLDRAAGYLTDDRSVATEAAEALARSGQDLFAAARHLDALRLLERAVALGCRRSSVLLDLAKVQTLCRRPEDVFETLAMVADDPDDPTVGLERDHTAANARVFTDPIVALPDLEAVTARWRELGVTDKEAWGHANLGVSYFNLSRMDEAGSELELALELFEQIGDKVGAVAASSFLCLARPTDRACAGWLAQALEFADQAGDRSRQLGTLTTLAWHHFIRSLWGTRRDSRPKPKDSPSRLAELAEELGAVDMVVHGRSLLAIMARFSGRLDEAARHAEVLERLEGTVDAESYPWIGRAATFVVSRGRGAVSLAPPLAPVASPDPVVAMALLVIEAELTLGGRIDRGVGALRHGRATGARALRRSRRRPHRPGARAGAVGRPRPCPGSSAPPRRPGPSRHPPPPRPQPRCDRDHRGLNGSAALAGFGVERQRSARAAGPRGARRRRCSRDPAAQRADARHAGPAPRAVAPLGRRPGPASADGGRPVPEKRLDVTVSDRERAPAVRATDVDVLLRHLDVLGFEDHGPPAEPAFGCQRRNRRPGTADHPDRSRS